KGANRSVGTSSPRSSAHNSSHNSRVAVAPKVHVFMSKDRVPIKPLPRSRTILALLGASFTFTLGAMLVLRALHVPLGQGYFVYRYSPLPETRTLRTFPLLLVAALACGAIHMLIRNRRRAGTSLLLLAMLAAAAWVLWAPPRPLEQHSYN